MSEGQLFAYGHGDLSTMKKWYSHVTRCEPCRDALPKHPMRGELRAFLAGDHDAKRRWQAHVSKCRNCQRWLFKIRKLQANPSVLGVLEYFMPVR